MKVNSGAIYGTKPVEPYKEGKVCLTQGKDGAIYMIYLADEGETAPPAKIWFSRLEIPDNATFSMLGTKEKLSYEKIADGIVVNIPEPLQKNPPCQDAWVIRVSP
jgi:alpha-L-fucosidase